MAPTRTFHPAAAIIAIASLCSAEPTTPAPIPSSDPTPSTQAVGEHAPSPDRSSNLAAAPATTQSTAIELIDAGAAPRALMRRTFHPGVCEQIAATTANSSVMAVVGGAKYPPTHEPPIEDAITATVVSTDAAGGARIEFTVTQTNVDASPADAAQGETPARETLHAALHIGDRGIASPHFQTASNDDNADTQKLRFWDRKIRLLVPPLPKEEIGVGAHWIARCVVPLDGIEVEQTVDYTLESINADELTILASLNISNHDERPLELNGLPDEVSGAITGIVVADAVRMTIRLDRLLPLAASDTSELMLLSRISSPEQDDINLMQYVQNRISVRGGLTQLANVTDDDE